MGASVSAPAARRQVAARSRFGAPRLAPGRLWCCNRRANRFLQDVPMPRHPLVPLFGLSLQLAAAAVSAGELYPWKDANGVTHYSQTPPASGNYTERTESGRSSAKPVETAATKPTESPQCATSRANIALLESKSPVQQDTDGDGKPDKTLDDTERANQLELARALLKANCAENAATAAS
jgi:hypothetical protein